MRLWKRCPTGYFTWQRGWKRLLENRRRIMGTGSASSFLHTEIHTTEEAFDDLRLEWDELLEASRQQNYFLRWHWARTWWKTFRPSHSHLFLITCRDADDPLIGLAPLYWRQRTSAGLHHLREILFLGTGI